MRLRKVQLHCGKAVKIKCVYFLLLSIALSFLLPQLDGVLVTQELILLAFYSSMNSFSFKPPFRGMRSICYLSQSEHFNCSTIFAAFFLQCRPSLSRAMCRTCASRGEQLARFVFNYQRIVTRFYDQCGQESKRYALKLIKLFTLRKRQRPANESVPFSLRLFWPVTAPRNQMPIHARDTSTRDVSCLSRAQFQLHPLMNGLRKCSRRST